MALNLIKIGLVLTAFYELIFLAFPYVQTIAENTREAKSFISWWLALAIGLATIYFGQIKQCSNKFILLFIGVLLPLSIRFAPEFPLIINGVKIDSFWVWQPSFYIICYFLMFMAVQSMNIKKEDLVSIFSIICHCGLVMAVYVILQKLGFEQFFYVKTVEQIGHVPNPELVGSLGQPTIVSAYLAMITPFCFYLKRYFSAILIIMAVIACQSDFSTGAMVVSIFLYSCLKWPFKSILGGIVAVSLTFLIISFVGYDFNENFDLIRRANGRVEVWQKTIDYMKDFEFGEKGNRMPFTGLGPSGYKMLLSAAIGTGFREAHNFYLTIYVCFGLFGIGVLSAAVWRMFYGVWKSLIYRCHSDEVRPILCSLICVSLIAFGSLIMRLSPFNFYTILLIGLLHNKKLLKEGLDV